MAMRATDSQVKEITGFSRSMAEFIETANLYVNKHLVDEGSFGPEDKMLDKIELYLAAHFATITEERGGLIQSEAMDASERYSDIYSGGLRSTRFGQQAIVLDDTKKLEQLARSNLKAQFRVV